MEEILLLRLGGEGGGLGLVLEMTHRGIFSFAIHRNSDDWMLREDEEHKEEKSHEAITSDYVGQYQAPLVIDWDGALNLLDDTGWAWPMLSPVFIHPSISHLILGALKDRYQRYPDMSFHSWEHCIKESHYKTHYAY
jgi:hypothetical protein